MDENICKICAENEGKYVCPRCNLLYCSVKCYQSQLHLRCSEEFYKENVLESMSVNSNDLESVNKMKDILNKIYAQDQAEDDDVEDDNLDSDDEVDIAERLKSVSLDDADAVWEKLSESEKQQFVDFVQNGCPESVIPLWEPWWNYRAPNRKIEEVDNASQEDPLDYETRCPELREVPPISEITKRAPAPCVVWNVINVIASYSYVLRYFNGDLSEFVSEAASLLISISGNLNANTNYEHFNAAVDEVAHQIIQCPWLDGSENALSRIKEDVQKIIQGPDESNKSFYLKAALSDTIRLMENAKNHDKKKGSSTEKKSSFRKKFQESGATPSIPKNKLKICVKKVEYYLSWVLSCCVKTSFT